MIKLFPTASALRFDFLSGSSCFSLARHAHRLAVCPVCGKTFLKHNREQIYCCRGCSNLSRTSSLCSRCDMCTGLCPWSHDFTPVDGWVAKKTLIKQFLPDDTGACTRLVFTPSYKVISCPLFVKTLPRPQRESDEPSSGKSSGKVCKSRDKNKKTKSKKSLKNLKERRKI